MLYFDIFLLFCKANEVLNMKKTNNLKNRFAFLGKELADKIFDSPTIMNFKAGDVILKQGQYITHIPVVIEGLVKVFSKYEDKDLLLYYISSDQSCIMSYSSGMNNEPSSVYALIEEDAEILLLPIKEVEVWTKDYPRFNKFFFQLYNLRYKDLLDTINHLLYDKLDKRVLDYLEQKSKLKNQNTVKITHRQIAEELGTAREVITRIIKKLERENHINISNKGITINT